MKEKTASAPVYVSAVDRLSRLPEVFTGSELTIFYSWKSSIASTYLAAWRAAGLVKSLGGRSDVHMNLLKNRNINPEKALCKIYPAVVKVGVDILREAGWTTQIPSVIEMAIAPLSSIYDVDGFDVQHRSEKWFSLVRPGIDRGGDGADRLKPAWALADMVARAKDKRVKNAWLLDPEDIDLESARSDKGIGKAFQAFGLDPDDLDDDGYERVYSEFTGQQRRRHERERS